MRPGLACLAVTLGLLCLFAPPTLVEQMELQVLDWHARLRGPIPPAPNVSIVAIDETSLQLVGRWPRMPDGRDRAAARGGGGARAIALDILLREPDENSRLVLAWSLAESYRARAGPSSHPTLEDGRSSTTQRVGRSARHVTAATHGYRRRPLLGS